GALFEAPADAQICAAAGRESRMLSHVFNLETNRRAVVVLVVATVALIAVLFRYGLPVMANVAARVTPAPVTALMDAGTLETVDRTLLSPSQLPPERQQALTARFVELAAHAETGATPLNLVFRSSPVIGAN